MPGVFTPAGEMLARLLRSNRLQHTFCFLRACRHRPNDITSTRPILRSAGAERGIASVVYTILAYGVERERAVCVEFVAKWLSVNRVTR